MNKVYAIGAGMTKFDRHPDKTGRDLAVEASDKTVESVDNGFDLRDDVEASYVGYFSPDFFEHQSHYGPLIADLLGITPKPSWRTESACASSSAAILTGYNAIKSGMIDVALVGGIEKMTDLTTAESTEALSLAADDLYELPAGVTFPGLFALIAQAYLKKYDESWERLQNIPIKSHYNGSLNPNAQYQSELLDIANKMGKKKDRSFDDPMEFLKSSINPPIAYPLKLFDCSPISDGASFAILASEDVATEYTDTPIEIAGVGSGTDTLSLADRKDMTTSRAAVNAAEMAYDMADVEPDDVDLAEVHDCFSINEAIQMEDLGLVPRGKGIEAAKKGRTSLDGDIPVNTDGGLKSKGHPVGATGVGMFTEVWKQLRGEVNSKRQVPEPRIGLSSNIGGSGATACTFILKR